MILLLLLFFAGCSQSKPPPPGAAGPAEAVQAFADALQRGDSATAWSLLSSSTQRSADAAAARARAGSDGGPESGREMLFQSALPGGVIEVRTVRESGDAAEVHTAAPDGGSPKTFHAVREGGRWRVDLPLPRG